MPRLSHIFVTINEVFIYSNIDALTKWVVLVLKDPIATTRHIKILIGMIVSK